MVRLIDIQDKWGDIVTRVFDKGYDSLTESEKVWFNVQSLIQSVDNGGADYALECVQSLDIIGATKAKSLLEQMNNLFPNSCPPRDLMERNEIINSWDDAYIEPILDEIDKKFFGQEDTLEDLLVQFIVDNNIST